MEEIQPLIKTFRGVQVILDKDLARLYGVETKRLNEQVVRNRERFPESFIFQLTMEECLRSQFATLNAERGKHLKYLPYVFTEQGVAMLSSVLRSPTAVSVSIKIIEAFVAMRRFVMANSNMFQRIESIELRQIKTDEKVDAILDRIEHNDLPMEGIFYDGQIFDAHTFVCDLANRHQHPQRTISVN